MIYATIEFTPLIGGKKTKVDCYCITTGHAYRGNKCKGECFINGKYYEFEAGCKINSKNLMFSKVVENTNKIKAKFIYYAGGMSGAIAVKSTFEWKRGH